MIYDACLPVGCCLLGINFNLVSTTQTHLPDSLLFVMIYLVYSFICLYNLDQSGSKNEWEMGRGWGIVAYDLN